MNVKRQKGAYMSINFVSGKPTPIYLKGVQRNGEVNKQLTTPKTQNNETHSKTIHTPVHQRQ